MATYDDIESRRTKIAELLSQRGLLSLGELSRTLGISESTARRDLEALEEKGTVKRTHGGAVCSRYASPQRLGFADRQTTMLREKQAIAQAVAGLIGDGQTIIIDGGTTCYNVAAALSGRNLSVVTNSVPIASLLFTDLSAEVTLVGGYLYPRTGVALGQTARQQLETLQASLVVMSCAGLGPDGAFNVNQMMVDVQRQMMKAAQQVVLAVDHTKFGLGGLAKLCELAEVDVIVTDSGVSPEHRAWLSSLAAQVIVA